MRAKLTLLSALVVGIVGGAAASGCQTYDFEPVEPLALAQTTVGDVISARALKPNLMLLLDTSGSMTLPVNTADPDCKIPNATPPNDYCGQSPSTPCPVATCPTRWSELQAAMGNFLDDSGSVARMGLTTYPGPAAGAGSLRCEASTTVTRAVPQSEDDEALQAAANEIQNVILGIPNSGPNQPSGGTPTSLSLRYLGQQPELQSPDREDFVLLLTDGLPNCNPDNPNTGANVDACSCTISRCQGDYARLGCLDMDASVAAVNELRQKEIRTIVIGFGAETAEGNGPKTLNAMAVAGGFPIERACTTNADCGAGDICDTNAKLCNRRFYQAANQEELAQALRDIIELVDSTDICLLKLDPAQRPSDDNLIVVYVDDQPTARGDNTWTLTEQGVQFVGNTCERIRNSTPSNPVKVEARAVQRK